MDATQIGASLADVFDQTIVFHGFADYMRDYDIFIYATADPTTGIQQEHLRYRFKYCVSATAETAVRPDVWKRSLDDRLIDYDTGRDLDGYVWGVAWQMLYPGFSLVQDSPAARQRSETLQIPFHEVKVETNGHNLALVFSDLVVDLVLPGTTPFVVPQGGPDFKIPLSP